MEHEFDRLPVWKLSLKLGLPAMLAQLFNILYSIVDRIYLGHMAENAELALASVGICSPAFTAVSGFASLAGVGGAALMSISLGSRERSLAQKALNNALVLLLLFSGVLTVGLLLAKRPLLYLLGCSDTMYPFAATYYTIYTMGTAAVLCGTGLNRFIMGQGYAREGMYSIAIGAILNIILDPVFIFALDMGIAGAALATILAQYGVLVYVIVTLLRKKLSIRLGFGQYDLSVCGRILKIGCMPFLVVFLDNFLIILLNSMLRRYGGSMGDQYISYAAVVQSIMVVALCPADGITSGCSTLFSYYYGAKAHKRILQSFRWVLTLCGIYLGLITLLSLVFPQLLAGLFLREDTAISTAASFIRRYAAGVAFVSIQYAFVEGFTAMGMVREAVPISLFRKSLYVISVLLLPRLLPLEDIFLAGSISDIAGSIFTLFMVFLVLLPRLSRKMQED